MSRYIQGVLLCFAGGALFHPNPAAGTALIAAGLCGTISAMYSHPSPSRAWSER